MSSHLQWQDGYQAGYQAALDALSGADAAEVATDRIWRERSGTLSDALQAVREHLEAQLQPHLGS